jgi:phage-related holin
MLHDALAVGFMFNEVFSILRNLSTIGVNVKNLQQSITQITGKKSDGGEE